MTARTAIILLLCSEACTAKKRPIDCPYGMFQPNVQASCQACSSCPNGQIMREACSQQHDTVCGPFKEFSYFQNVKMVVNSNNNGVNEKQLSKVDSDDVSDDVSDDEWNLTSLALISILSLTSVAFAAVLVILCYQCMQETRHGLLAEAETLGSEAERSQNSISGPWQKSVLNDYTNALPSGSRFNVVERSET